MLKILLSLTDITNDLMALLKPHNVETLKEGASLTGTVSDNSYKLIILDRGISILPSIRKADPRAEIILFGDSEVDAVEAVRMGASAFFELPVDLEKLERTIGDIEDLFEMRRETAELERLLNTKCTFAGVVGRNPGMLEIFSFIRRIAPYYKTVTIMGETGTGKEVIAKALHSLSPAPEGPFVVCNCSALVEGLIESELFGHARGAFTGAIRDKVGLFEAANKGTIFLDEIGELPLSFQPHLLRVLQDGEFRRVGSNQSLRATCRVIAVTNKDLAQEVKSGRFREDLYYRLTPLTIQVPPLAERKDDIPLICRFLLDKFTQRTGKRVSGISRPAQIALMSYNWPGNVRELENVIEQAAILTSESFIRLDDIPSYLRDAKHEGVPAEASLDVIIKRHIEAALIQHDGNRTDTARALGISRRALSRKIQRYKL